MTAPELHSLPLFHRLAGTAVVVVGDGEMAAAKRRLIARAGGRCCDEREPTGARLAFVALEDAAEAERAALRLKARGLLVNVADRPELCDFTLPSVLARGDVLVAVSTGGASAGLAKQLRLRLEGLLPASLAQLAEGLAAARGAMRARWPDAAARRRALDAALAPGSVLDPLEAASAQRVDDWLAAAPRELPPQVVEIALTSDDPDDLTLRQARWLGTADTIVHPANVPAAILARARADAARFDAASAVALGPGLTVVLRRASDPPEG